MRGQNNVQGACDMGALPNVFPGYPSVSTRGAGEVHTRPAACTMPEDMGLRTPEMLELAVHGTLKAMYIMGEDPVLTEPTPTTARRSRTWTSWSSRTSS